MSQPLTGSARAAALDAFRKKGRKSPVTAPNPAPAPKAKGAEKSPQNERQAPQTGLGHPAAREATHSSTTPDEIQAYHAQSDAALRAFRAGLDAAREGRGPKEVNLR